MECVESVVIDHFSCLKPCSGLIVSSLSKTELKQNVEDLLYFAEDYNTYIFCCFHMFQILYES